MCTLAALHKAKFIALHLKIVFNIGVSPSGKAQDFDSCIRGFKSRHPSQTAPFLKGCFLF